ncbi:RNase P/RNase MRP complex subunit [Coemansia sp. BCRC 34301]|nr:RNase P/RNase MRP complex subunit [Coemansia sp. BCRC 34301]
MSDNSAENIGFYTPLPTNMRTRSGAPLDVPLDSSLKFANRFVAQSINTEISDIRAQSTFKDRVEGRQLLLTNSYKEPPEKNGKVNGRKRITAKERRALGIYDIPADAQKYALFVPLHQLWSQYVGGITGGWTGDQLLGRVMRADMHGALLTVTRARCPNYVGIRGIVAQETKNAFRIITQADRLVTVPKAHCVFTLSLPSGTQCVIYGDQFAFRASDRASRKFKPKPSIEL